MTSPDWARPVVYFSIQAVDQQKQCAFYSELFNWNIAEGPFMSIPAGIGSPENGISGHISASPTAGFTLYVQVRNIHESLAKAIQLGASKTHDAIQIPNGPMIAGISDPEGNSLTLVQQ